MIELCLCLYKRTNRLDDLIEDLKHQTYQDFNLHIWNNGNETIANSLFPTDRIRIVNSRVNLGSQARFILAKQTIGNPIIFIDDDLSLMPDFVEYNYNQYIHYGNTAILGWFGRRFHNESYWDSVMIDSTRFCGVAMDYIGTGGMILDRWIVDQEESLQHIPEEYNQVEDLYLSYIARCKYNMKLILIHKKCHYIHDDHDQYKELIQYKENAFRSLRRAGWHLLKDNLQTE